MLARSGIPAQPHRARLLSAALSAVILSLAAAPLATRLATAAAIPEPARELRFDVFLDDRPIGYQRFALQPNGDDLRVDIRAAFEFTLLRLKTITYDHRNVEQWRGGCLRSIESKTRQNGKPDHVSGRAEPSGFAVSSRRGSQRLDTCVGTFAYWDKREILKRRKLLNSQTGEYVDVATRSLGRGTLALGGREIPVERYRIEGDGLAITLAYAVGSDEWVALESPLFAGWTLRYRRSTDSLPGDPARPVAAPSAAPASAPSTALPDAALSDAATGAPDSAQAR